MRPSVVPPPCGAPTAPTPNSVMSVRMFCRWNNPKWMPRFIPASLPFASKVANAGSKPVRMLEFLPAFVESAENTQNAFTFPENENVQPFDICIVRPCALAVVATPSAKPNNSNVRRFIRESLLGSLPDLPYRSCPARHCHDSCPALGTVEWERGPPTSNARLASHLRDVTERKSEPTSSRERVDRAVHCGRTSAPVRPASAQHFPPRQAKASRRSGRQEMASESIPKPRGGSTSQPPLDSKNPAEYWMEAPYKQQTGAKFRGSGRRRAWSRFGTRWRNQWRGERIGHVEPSHRTGARG